MAQMMLEGGGSTNQYGDFGLSLLAYKYNNYGGIKKWSGYTGSSVAMKTGEETKAGKTYMITADFCVFSDVTDFIKWRTVFLKRNSRYYKNGVFSAVTPLAQITALKNAGYATDTKYVSKIMSIVNQYKLSSLDERLKKKLNPVSTSPVGGSRLNLFQYLMNIFNPIDSAKNAQ